MLASSIRAEDNQSSINLASPPSTTAIRIIDVPICLATASSLSKVGRPVGNFASAGCDITPWPTKHGGRPLVPGTGVGGGTVEDVFHLARAGGVQFATNVGLSRHYVTGWYGADPALAKEAIEPSIEDRRSLLTHEANYHPCGGQVFACRNGAPFVLLLAPPGDDVKPSDFVAFLVDPARSGFVGVHVNAGTWHQPALPAWLGAEEEGGRGGTILDNRQGAVHACVSIDFVKEWNAYLRVPLCLS
jgi:ureidoglycolate lyase